MKTSKLTQTYNQVQVKENHLSQICPIFKSMNLGEIDLYTYEKKNRCIYI